jgi:uncharacterized protein
METFISLIGKSLLTSFNMFWEVLWPLAFGFTLSGIIQAVVSKRAVAGKLGCDQPRCHTFASLFGAASSSCSYAAVALARSLFRKGASFTSSMIFEIASTNLVLELGLALIVILGWQFMAAEVVGGILMIIIISFIFRHTLNQKLVEAAKVQANKNIAGKMEGHATMDLSVFGGSFFSRLLSPKGFTAVSHYYVMDWLSVWIDVVVGFLLAGILATFVPDTFWQSLFFTDKATLAFLIGPLIGPVVAIISFVCSVGNIPLAAVLWRGGISFGGVISFIFADLLVIPILNIYRKYYGRKMTLYIFATFFIAMAAAGYIVEIIFSFLRLIPTNRNIFVFTAGISLNYTAILNIIFLTISAVFVVRFFKTGGLVMLGMTGESSEHKHKHQHSS